MPLKKVLLSCCVKVYVHVVRRRLTMLDQCNINAAFTNMCDLLSTVHSEANARRIAIVESCFGSAGVVSSNVYSGTSLKGQSEYK